MLERNIQSGPLLHRLLFDQAGVAMIAADLEGRITAWNHAATRLFGAGSSEMLNTDWSSVVPGDERAHARSGMLRALQDGAVTDFEFDLRDEHGRSRRLAAIVTPIADSEGNRIGGLACVRDITNRAALQERLAQQHKMAALGELAGALSHHLNNILGGIVTSVDFALDSHDPNVMARVMETSAAALTRATTLMDSLLAFAEGDFRDAGLSDLGEVLVQQIQRYESRIAAASIHLRVELRPIPVVEVPNNQMSTVIGNLLDNAIEAMPSGGTISVTLSNDEHDCMIQIVDTGVGLDEANAGRIFEPFFSTKRQDSEERLSRGLGLAVAHGMIKSMHGTIQVRSTPGHGAAFEVRVPLPQTRSAKP